MNITESLVGKKTIQVMKVGGIVTRVPIDEIKDVVVGETCPSLIINHARIPIMGLMDDVKDVKSRIEQARQHG